MIIPAIIGAKPASGDTPYVASAVHFDGSAWLDIASLTSTDNGLFSAVLWMKSLDQLPNALLWVSDINGNDNSFFYFAVGDPGLLLPRSALGDVTGSLSFTTPGSSPLPATWFALMFSADTNHAAAAKIVHMYLGDTNIALPPDDGDSAFVSPFNGEEFTFGGDTFEGDAITADVADVWIAPGQFIDFSIEANRRKFIDAGGKPVFLGANGELPTSTIPRIFFSGGASTFATNLGTGGAFTLTGLLTNASTSPSD